MRNIMNKDPIKEFKCMVCGKKFTELTPIHEKRCICKDCYEFAIAETYNKGLDVMPIKKLKKIVKDK